MLATEYAEYYNIEKQRQGESDLAFRSRVALRLREMGKPVLAHEAYQDERYEDNDTVQFGVLGFVAQALQDRSYRGDAIGNDIASGIIAGTPKDDMSSIKALLLMAMS